MLHWAEAESHYESNYLWHENEDKTKEIGMSENGKDSRANQTQLGEDGRSNAVLTGGALPSSTERPQQQTGFGQLTQQFVEEIDYDEIETEEV